MSRPRNEPGTLGNITTTPTPSGRWFADAWFFDHQRQRHRLRATGTTPADAERHLRERADERLRTGHQQITADMTVRDAITAWIRATEARQPAISTRTVDLYRDWGRQLADTCGDLLMHQLTVGACDAILQRIREERSIAAARNTKKALSLLCGLAARHGALTHNPVRDTTRLHGTAKIESSLTGPAFRRLRELITEWRTDQSGGTQPDRVLLDAAVVLMCATSMRPSEVLALRRRDITDATRPDGTRDVAVDVRGKIVQVRGEGAVRDPIPKHQRQSRTISLPQFAHPVIDWLQARCPAPDDDALLFATATGRPRSVSNLERLVRTFRDDHADRIESELGVPASEFTCKLFRRTAATVVDAHAGVDLAAELLGHADAQTTRRHYAVKLPRVSGQTALLLDEHLGHQPDTIDPAPPPPARKFASPRGKPNPAPAQPRRDPDPDALPDNVIQFRPRPR